MKVKSRDRRNYIALVEATSHAHPRKYFIAFLRESKSEVVFYSSQSNVKAKRTNKKFDKIKAKFYTEAFLDLIDNLRLGKRRKNAKKRRIENRSLSKIYKNA